MDNSQVRSLPSWDLFSLPICRYGCGLCFLNWGPIFFCITPTVGPQWTGHRHCFVAHQVDVWFWNHMVLAQTTTWPFVFLGFQTRVTTEGNHGRSGWENVGHIDLGGNVWLTSQWQKVLFEWHNTVIPGALGCCLSTQWRTLLHPGSKYSTNS